MGNRVGLAVVGIASIACVVAAGTGGYLATRHANTPAAAAAPAEAGSLAQAAVQETEAAIDDPKPAAVSAPEPANVPSQPVVAPREAVASAAPERPTPAPRRPSTPARVSRNDAPAPEAQPVRRTTVDDQADHPVATVPQPQHDQHDQAPLAAPVDPLPAPDMARRGEPVDAQGEPEPRFEQLVVPGDSVIGLQMESTVTSETARVEDRVDARVTRDVTVHGRVAVPAGTRVRGAVTMIDRGGKMRDRARLGVRFHTLVLADGTTLPLQTETIFREGDSPAPSSSAKIGGAAIGGALLGAIIGGARGAVIGGTTGAAGGTAAVMAGGRRAATLGAGSTMTVRVLSPVSVTVERN